MDIAEHIQQNQRAKLLLFLQICKSYAIFYILMRMYAPQCARKQ